MWENAQRRKAADPSYDGGEGGAADEGNDDGLPEPPELTEKEAAEQKRLVEKGFATWRAADLKAFVRGCELYGRDDVAAVASEVEGKEEREVARYASVFFARYQELKDGQKLLAKIERGEALIQKRHEQQRVLAKKVSQTKSPWVNLRIDYGGHRDTHKHFTEDEDRFLVCKTNELGFGRWEELRVEVRTAWQFRLDWWFKTRTTQELSKRVAFLAEKIEAEVQQQEEAERAAEKGKKKGKGKAAAAEEPPKKKARK